MIYKHTQFTQSAHLYNYELTHYYSLENTSKDIAVAIEPATMKLLLAYIEFYSEQHYDQSWSLSDETLIQVIQNYYSPVYEPTMETPFTEEIQIDLYFNREALCGTGLDENKYFERNMKDLITKLNDQEKQKILQK